MNRNLFINKHPIIQTHIHTAFALAIMERQHGIPLSKYIDFLLVESTRKGYNLKFPYSDINDCCFDGYGLSISYDLLRYLNTTSLIKDSIQKGYYVYCQFDYNIFKGYNHDYLIFGYNDEESTFSVLGYNMDDVFSEFTVTDYELKNYLVAPYPQFHIQLRKPKKHNITEYDTRDVLSAIKNYVYPKSNSNTLSGIDVFKDLSNMLQDNIKNNDGIYLRMYDILLEHKLVFEKVLLFLANERIIDYSIVYNYRSVIDVAKQTKETCVNYNKTLDPLLLKEIEKSLDNLITEEFNILSSIID